jgi:hypothetical protein
MTRILCGAGALVLAMEAPAWLFFGWLYQGLAGGLPLAALGAAATLAAVWTLGRRALAGRWPRTGRAGALLCAAAATVLCAARDIFLIAPSPHLVDGGPWRPLDAVVGVLVVVGVACAAAGFFKLLPPRVQTPEGATP